MTSTAKQNTVETASAWLGQGRTLCMQRNDAAHAAISSRIRQTSRHKWKRDLAYLQRHTK